MKSRAAWYSGPRKVAASSSAGIVVPAEIFAEHPERFAPIVEFDVGAALLGEEGLLAAVAEIANDRNLVIGIVDLGAHLAGRPGIEIGEEGRARLRLVAHAKSAAVDQAMSRTQGVE